jgi:hypothetical protein
MRSLRRRGLVVELLPNFAFTKKNLKLFKKLLPKKNFLVNLKNPPDNLPPPR